MIKDTRITLDQIEGRTVDLELVIRPVDKDKLYKKFVSRRPVKTLRGEFLLSAPARSPHRPCNLFLPFLPERFDTSF